jgi:hypothetical protein
MHYNSFQVWICQRLHSSDRAMKGGGKRQLKWPFLQCLNPFRCRSAKYDIPLLSMKGREKIVDGVYIALPLSGADLPTLDVALDAKGKERSRMTNRTGNVMSSGPHDF